MRPYYEASSDLVNEQLISRQVCTILSCDAKKLPISYGLDFALCRGANIIAFAEVKKRQNHSSTYETIMVSALKRMKAREITSATGRPCFFIVEYSDGIFLIDFKEAPDSVEHGGRSDRGDSADQEPVIHYRIDRMKCLSVLGGDLYAQEGKNTH